MKSALRRVRGEGNPKCDDSTDKFRDWDSDRGLSKKLPKTCGYHKSIPKANAVIANTEQPRSAQLGHMTITKTSLIFAAK